MTVIVNKTPFYGHVHFEPNHLPEIDKDLTQKEEQVLSVYNDGTPDYFQGTGIRTQFSL